jgi:glycine dehydrogenase subunit 1
MICELTAMDVSNASLYDGATALVEAANMSHVGGRARFLVSSGVDPRLVATLRTYSAGPGYAIEIVDEPPAAVEADVAALVVQHPNVYGAFEDVRRWAAAAHEGGARLIQVFDPTSLGVLAPPGELGADIAVAEGQPLGNHLAFGGPYLGLLAARMADVRRMPGRIVGETVDVEGRTGYVLTLQAREQHIRRERATSNICTNQTLMAIAATVYLAWLGPEGSRELGESCAAKAAYACRALTAIEGVRQAFPDTAFFKEFTLLLPQDAVTVRDGLLERGFLAGVPALELDPAAITIAVTERRTVAEIDALAAAMKEVLS